MSKQVFNTTLNNKPFKVEIGEVAKQSNASALIYYGDTVVLSTVVSKNVPTTLDFFPLMVIYQEKLYAAGKIPGGFLRREGRPSEKETLVSRLIDRPIRPLFADGFRNEVQIINMVLSSDPDCPSDMAALFGSSLVLGMSNIPFNGPVSGVTIGMIDNEFIINPTDEQLEVSKLELCVAGTSKAINMVEAAAKEVSEETMLKAIEFGHNIIKQLNTFQLEIISKVGVEKVVPELFSIDEAVQKDVLAYAQASMVNAIRLEDKIERYAKIAEIKENTLEHFKQVSFFNKIDGKDVFDFEAQKTFLKQVKLVLDSIVTKEVRRLITVDKIRPDGRKSDEIRDLASRVDVLPRTHGSALFTRGQTQGLGIVTLGSLRENQIIDGLGDEATKRFMLHYNFPQFSVGETGRYGPPGRREIGHGALGERALLQVLPNEEEFPYSIRIVSEILESNGSSSQATICAGSMALMAAGVPIKGAVAGIAMGLIMDGDHYTILTDIQGMEDHEGDMDFKVAGTKEGITALQMDIKIEGITPEILKESLSQALVGRLAILDHMNTVIEKVRPEVSEYAPKLKMFRINPDKIRDVIGAGGKIITQIIEDFNGIKIDIEQDGRVFIMHHDTKWINLAMEHIQNLVKEAEVGQIYQGKVTRLLMDKDGKKANGCFVELWPGCEGLVHVSKLDTKRVEKVEDVVKIGDIISVKCIKIDDKGRVDLSRKDALIDILGQ